MNVEELRAYCLAKAAVTESFPFDDSTLVYKVMDKMFALIPLNTLPTQINLKCDPEIAIALREEHDGHVLPGYHMNKKHWNTVFCTNLNPKLVKGLIDDSYQLVVNKLPKTKRNQLQTFPSKPKK